MRPRSRALIFDHLPSKARAQPLLLCRHQPYRLPQLQRASRRLLDWVVNVCPDSAVDPLAVDKELIFAYFFSGLYG
jgi:hypothetical protein